MSNHWYTADQEISQQLENITLSTQTTGVSTTTSSSTGQSSSIIKIESMLST